MPSRRSAVIVDPQEWSIAVHMNVMARHVAFVMSSLTEQEAAELPWHRVVSQTRTSGPNMDAALSWRGPLSVRMASSFRATSFGHFHEVWRGESFRRLTVNAILWAAKLEVPEAGAPVALGEEALALPPDPREKP